MRKVKLKEVANIKGGSTPKTKVDEYWNGNIIWLSPSDLPDVGEITTINNSARKITTKGLNSCSAALLPKGTVIYSSRASIGKIALNEVPVATNQGFINFICNDDIYNRYLAYTLKYFTRELVQLSNSTTFKEISKSAIKDFEIPLPSWDEQKLIVEKLDKAQHLISIEKKIEAKYIYLLRSLFLEKFGDPLTNSKNWEKVQIKDLGKVVLGNTPPKKDPENYGDELEWVKTSNISDDSFYPSQAEEFLSQKGKELGRVIPEGSLIVCCIAGSLSSIGKCAITDREIAINQQINAIVPDTEVVDVNYLYTLLLVGQELIQDASTKSMKGMVSKTRFKEIELMLPPLELQKEFSQIFEKIVDEKRKLIMESGKSQELYSSLLQKSFT